MLPVSAHRFTALSARFTCLFRIELVRCASFVSCPAALASYFALPIFVHRSKAVFVVAVTIVVTPVASPISIRTHHRSPVIGGSNRPSRDSFNRDIQTFVPRLMTASHVQKEAFPDLS